MYCEGCGSKLNRAVILRLPYFIVASRATNNYHTLNPAKRGMWSDFIGPTTNTESFTSSNSNRGLYYISYFRWRSNKYGRCHRFPTLQSSHPIDILSIQRSCQQICHNYNQRLPSRHQNGHRHTEMPLLLQGSKAVCSQSLAC